MTDTVGKPRELVMRPKKGVDMKHKVSSSMNSTGKQQR